MKAVSVFIENSPNQWHVVTGRWGEPSVAVCKDEQTARLFAAAPELLGACKLAKGWMDSQIGKKEGILPAEVFEILRDAIAKVEGG